MAVPAAVPAAVPEQLSVPATTLTQPGARAQRERKAPERESLGYESPSKKKAKTASTAMKPAEIKNSSHLQARRKVQLRGFAGATKTWYTGVVLTPAEGCDFRQSAAICVLLWADFRWKYRPIELTGLLCWSLTMTRVTTSSTRRVHKQPASL